MVQRTLTIPPQILIAKFKNSTKKAQDRKVNRGGVGHLREWPTLPLQRKKGPKVTQLM